MFHHDKGQELGPGSTSHARRRRSACRHRYLEVVLSICIAVSLVTLCPFYWPSILRWGPSNPVHPVNAARPRARCASLHLVPEPPADFYFRRQSDRYVPGTPATLLKNATIWTGTGHAAVRADILLDGGIIKEVGIVTEEMLEGMDVVQLELNGAWVTPGLVDLHSHSGVNSVPLLGGAQDGNSFLGPVQPYLRAVDGLNTHDDSYALAIAGGVTSSLILPGSANNMGGQGVFIKLRKTKERSPYSMTLEPPYGFFNGTDLDPSLPPRWRHSKHACGENPSRSYASTRLDSGYRFREAYSRAAALRDRQDSFCANVHAEEWEDLGEFPDSLELESLVDTLRGRVKVNVHCYEAVDIDVIVRLSNEFKFEIAAFHHAAETYLVPDLLKKAWGKPPASAIFATFARVKREAYRHSEFAAKFLSEAGLPVVMKSDSPSPVRSRYLMYEAQQAHYYGLNASLALASVTSVPAEASGYSHRIGLLKAGYDADVVVWDSHPLRIGATPKQVWIDGIAQLPGSIVVRKPDHMQQLPSQVDFESEAKTALLSSGETLPSHHIVENVIFSNVRSIWQRAPNGDIAEFVASHQTGGPSELLTVAVIKGRVECVASSCSLPSTVLAEHIDLKGGSLSPGLSTFGSPLGLTEINFETSTSDGYVYDYFSGRIPSVLGKDAVLRSVDGLQFGGKDPILAFRAGVTTAITAPMSSESGFLGGLSTVWRTSARSRAEKCSIIQPVAAIHVNIGRGGPSVSAQIAALRHLLLSSEDSAFSQASRGALPLVVSVNSADIMATLLELKEEVEEAKGSSMKLVFYEAAESHLLAKQLADAKVGVIVGPPRAYPETWDQRRALPGPPLSEDTVISRLLDHNVTVAIGTAPMWQWQARNTRFEAAWAALAVYPKISKAQALAMVTTNLDTLLGLQTSCQTDLVAYAGGDMFDDSKVVAVISDRGKDDGYVTVF